MIKGIEREDVSSLTLDEEECLNLSSILDSLRAPVSEEHAWALCYQFAKRVRKILNDSNLRDSCCFVSKLKHVFVHRNGHIHLHTFVPSENRSFQDSRVRCACEFKLISKFSVIIFNALDYGLKDEEERQLSPKLESLLETMTCAEGGDSDSDDDPESPESTSSQTTLDRILEICSRHVDTILKPSDQNRGSRSKASYVTSKADVDAYYKTVGRQLVMDALSLSAFLKTVTQTTTSIRSTPEGSNRLSLKRSPLYHFHFLQPSFDWIRLWIHVVHELPKGRKTLKHVKYGKDRLPHQYELTPYEKLLNDIRHHHYALKRVLMVESGLPKRVPSKDTHSIMLEVIRSKPPLKRASDRILPPPPSRQPNPWEALMESIRTLNRPLKQIKSSSSQEDEKKSSSRA